MDRIPIYVRPLKTESVGLGAFCSPLIPSGLLKEGTFICLYAGEYLTTPQAKERWAVAHDGIGEGNYILTLRLPGQRIHIDPRYKGNAGRFFNHSCDPSCVVHVVRWGGSSIWPRAAIFVRQPPYEEQERETDQRRPSGISCRTRN